MKAKFFFTFGETFKVFLANIIQFSTRGIIKSWWNYSLAHVVLEESDFYRVYSLTGKVHHVITHAMISGVHLLLHTCEDTSRRTV